MNQIFNKFIKIFKLSALGLLFVVIILIVSVTVIPKKYYMGGSYDLPFEDRVPAMLEKIGFFDMLFGNIEFRISGEHQKIYGIETAKISSEEEKNLNEKIKKSIKAQLEYYTTKNEESLEKVKNLYLPKAFEQYKEYVKLFSTFQEAKSGNQSYDKIEKMKFSPPRIYKDLPDRIGMINFIKFNYRDNSEITQIFIFKNTNSDWKIEKQVEVNIQLGETEAGLIKQIIDSQK
ncbi:hypothetical protein KKB43_06875 [Patescibacteria group bacterium]|nr:hypothetical protein [Patescibacteria group bacterium]MBU4580702.1 hypothetical protein [Patescibacteria group bacterium]